MYIPCTPHLGIFIAPVENSNPCEILAISILSGLGASAAGRGPAWAPCMLQHNQLTPGLETLSDILQCDVHILSYANNAAWGEKDEESLPIHVHKERDVQRWSWQICHSSGGGERAIVTIYLFVVDAVVSCPDTPPSVLRHLCPRLLGVLAANGS